MNLSGLLDLAAGRRAYGRLLKDLVSARPPGGRQSPDRVSASVLEPAKPMVLACLQRDLNRPLIVIVANEHR
ncbi:MAG: hypothetical protein ACRDIY_08190, partial [Chloroflexota bacterium]